MEKNLVLNLQYGSKTRLIRGIYWKTAMIQFTAVDLWKDLPQYLTDLPRLLKQYLLNIQFKNLSYVFFSPFCVLCVCVIYLYIVFFFATIILSIYTLSDLGDLSNLIDSLSRTIQQNSPPSEWIMCELVFFPIFLEKDLLKVDKILGLTFFRQEKTSKDSKRRFSIYCC